MRIILCLNHNLATIIALHSECDIFKDFVGSNLKTELSGNFKSNNFDDYSVLFEMMSAVISISFACQNRKQIFHHYNQNGFRGAKLLTKDQKQIQGKNNHF